MTIDNRTGLVRRDLVQTRGIELGSAEHVAAKLEEALDAHLPQGFSSSPAERMHYLQMMLSAGFGDMLAAQVADAVTREIWASTMRPLPGKQQYVPPFYDPSTQALGQQMLQQFFVALGVPPQLAAQAAQWFADMIAPPQFYQPLWQGLGGQGDFNLDQLRQLMRGRGSANADAVSNQRLRNQTNFRRPPPQPSNAQSVEELIDQALRGTPRRSGERPRFEVGGGGARRRTDPGADLLRHRVNSEPASIGASPKPADRTRATRDAAAIREAVEGWGTDEDRLISILSNRSNADIAEIKRAYQEMYGESLEQRVRSETSGDLQTSLLSMLRGERAETSVIDPVKISRDVAAIRTAVEGWGTDEDALIRVLTNRSSAEIQALATAYQETYGESLRERIDSETSGDLRTTLLAQLDRRDGTEQRPVVVDAPATPAGADRNAATRAATAMREAMEGIGTDEEALIRQLRGKTNAEIAEIKAAYQQMYGESLEERVRSETSGDFRTALMGMLSGTRVETPVVDQAAATRDAVALREAMQGWGTDEDTLTRILSSRSPAQIQAIAQAYQQMYGEGLRQRVSDETSGDYRRTLLAMIDG